MLPHDLTPDPELRDRLSASPVFQGAEPEALDTLAAVLRPVELPAGRTLLATGEPAHGLYVVLDGELHVKERTRPGDGVLARVIGPGEAVDELQVLAAGTGSVVVEVGRDSRVAGADGTRVDELVAFPGLRACIDRLHRRQLLCRLHPIFGTLDGEFLDLVEAMADWVQVPRGELLFEQNSPGEGVYLVISGRVRTLRYGRNGSMQVLDEAGRGEMTGEMAFFGAARREERVQAVRDSVLVGFTNAEFEQLVARRPQILRHVTRTLVERIHRAAAPAGGRVINMAVLPATPGVPLDGFTTRLADALAAFGPTLRLNAERVEQLMNEPGIAQAWEDASDGGRLLAWLEAREADHRFVVYEADPRITPWTRRCMRQADRILLVAEAGEDPAPGAVERELHDLEGQLADLYEVLVLLHRDGSALPTGTGRWLADRPVKEHHHVRWDSEADFVRLARFLAGRAVGVVLGGGGARGFAHIGILRALGEAGIPVDFIGGTSMGGSIAAQYAMGLTPDQIVRINRRIYFELKPHTKFTIPVLSLVNTHRAEMCGRLVFGDAQIEDLWINFFCISSNLTTAEMVVHRRGLVRKAALASASIPGFALPVLEGNHLLVDGAVLNNVPTDVMRRFNVGTVIASEVSVEEDETFTCDRIPSPWELVRSRLSGRTGVVRFPSIMEVAMRASLLHSTSRERESLQNADFCLRPPIDRFRLMDFPLLEEIVATGYEYAREAVREWRWEVQSSPGGRAKEEAITVSV
ncbi:MAG TPA: cyclic nucleotide-binding domain-containing protein [Longimicrobiaceae bacterium]|nr:cyclic nucleotide-binding domain-containing protein [Longimicrobiaceae bacterium]